MIDHAARALALPAALVARLEAPAPPASPLPWIGVGLAAGALALALFLYRATRRPRHRTPPAIALAPPVADEPRRTQVLSDVGLGDLAPSPAATRPTASLASTPAAMRPTGRAGAARRTQALVPRPTIALAPWAGPAGVAGWLVSLSGASPYTTSVVNRAGETVIGADPDCGIVVHDDWVGARHCAIVGRAGGFTLVDLGSWSGVYVDGERVRGGRTLVSGMEIRIGQTRFAWQAVTREEPSHAGLRAPGPGDGSPPAP